MRAAIALSLATTLGLLGCDETLEYINKDLGSCEVCKCPAAPDLSMPQPTVKCAAAKGLSGDNLLCIDFNQVTSLADSKLIGWDFSTSAPCPGWEVVAGQLQLKSGVFMGDCKFTLPMMPAPDFQRYTSFTLSIVQTLNLAGKQLEASVLLSAYLPSRTIWQTTGNYPKQISTIRIDKIDLPPKGMASIYQAYFKIQSEGVASQGWQIESIAIQGHL